MATPTSQEITHLLLARTDDDQAALEQLIPLVHAGMHRLAKGYMVGERRGFGRLTTKETAEVLKVSPRKVEREWSLARVWLYRELRGKDEA
jgi:ECF sigma factor